ncbi:beta-defensin 136 [Rattus rattus]|uniref:beta-defensin 136 n=1 Tax=Rattus rattus TaxID=10117 RepID=UPI0013F2C176|nr:beta-defensin 136 [Rattus rattus]
MDLRLLCLLLFLVTSLPDGYCVIGNSGVSFKPCTSEGGYCFFGCKLGWIWINYCNNIMSCCKKDTKHSLPQTKGV